MTGRVRPWGVLVKLRKNYVIPGLTGLFVLSLFAIFFHISRTHRELMETTVLRNAAMYTQAIADFRTLYTSEVVGRLLPKGVPVVHDYESVDGAIPLPATLSIRLGETLGRHQEGAITRLYSPFPFPWREASGGLRDSFGHDAWEHLSLDPHRPFYRFERFQDRKSLRYATADLMRPACVECHNSHPDSPKATWRVGDVRGILETVHPLDGAISNTQEVLADTFIVMSAVTIMMFIGLAITLHRLLASSRSLERRVFERTESLAEVNKRLRAEIQERQRVENDVRESLSEIQAKNKELDAFAHVASHDLKSPLRAIRTLANWVSEDAAGHLPEISQKHLRQLQSRVQRAQRFLDDLLAYTRAGRAQTPHEKIDTVAMIEGISTLLKPPGRFTIDIEPDMPAVEGARAPLEQVLRNLIDNAIKHHPRQDGRIVVSVENAGDFLSFAVSDDGSGIPRQFHERIFEMFQTLRPRDEVEGSGMGLALVKKLVEQHGGSITVESVEGLGTTFRFTWPRRPNAEPPGHGGRSGGGSREPVESSRFTAGEPPQ